jgi:hypothetical protein
MIEPEMEALELQPMDLTYRPKKSTEDPIDEELDLALEISTTHRKTNHGLSISVWYFYKGWRCLCCTEWNKTHA